MNHKEHNGWYNYETWCVNLWMDNEEGSYRYWREVAQECYDDAEATNVWTRIEAAKYSLADRLKDEHEDAKPDLGCTVWADLIGAALSEVNWDEIAGHLIEEVEQEEPVEAEDE